MKNILFVLFAAFFTTAAFAQQSNTNTVPDQTPAKSCAGMKDGKACANMKDGKACAGMKDGKACCAAGAKTSTSCAADKATGSTDTKVTDQMTKKTAVASTNGLETAKFKVNGNCGMCKKTIEKGAKTGGAASADWNPDTHEIVITYDSKSANLDAIHKAIAATGYDTEKVKGDDAAYKKLHACCQYDRTNM